MNTCEICHVQPATVEVKQFQDGVLREMDLCEKCAAKLGIQSPESLAASLLDGFGSAKDQHQRDDDITCPECHMRLVDFRRASRLGCATCYEAFGRYLEEMLASMHGAATYLGKIPAKVTHDQRLNTMQEALVRAIADEDFETAAQLRDEIQDVQVSMSSVGTGGDSCSD